MQQLVYPLRLQQVAQSVLAEIPHGGAGRQGVAGKQLGRRGEENLPAMAGGQQPGEAVERGREVIAALVRLGLPRVQRHPHPQAAYLREVVGKQGALTVEGGGDGGGGGREGGLDRIANGLEVNASVRLDGGIEQDEVAVDSGRHRVTVLLPALGTAFDVREEEGDGAGGQIGHGHSTIATCSVNPIPLSRQGGTRELSGPRLGVLSHSRISVDSDGHPGLDSASHPILASGWNAMAVRASTQLRNRRNDSAVCSASVVACSRESRRPCAHAAAKDSSPSAARAVSIARRF